MKIDNARSGSTRSASANSAQGRGRGPARPPHGARCADRLGAPEGRGQGGLGSARIEEIVARIGTGHYDSPHVLAAVVDRLLRSGDV